MLAGKVSGREDAGSARIGPVGHLDVARASGRQRVTNHLDVGRRAVDAEQDGARFDLALELLRPRLGQPRTLENGLDAPRHMAGRFAEPEEEPGEVLV